MKLNNASMLNLNALDMTFGKCYNATATPFCCNTPFTMATIMTRLRRFLGIVHVEPNTKKLPAASKHHQESYNFQLVTCYFQLVTLTNYFPPLAAAITASETLAGGGA